MSTTENGTVRKPPAEREPTTVGVGIFVLLLFIYASLAYLALTARRMATAQETIAQELRIPNSDARRLAVEVRP